MNKIVSALVALGFACPADATEDQVCSLIRENVGALKTERDSLKTENGKHAEARKARVQAKVKGAVTAKLLKPEREASLVALGVADESNLDFIDDLTAAAAVNTAGGDNPRAQRTTAGAPALGHEGAAAGKSTDDQIIDLKLQMREERDPLKMAALVRKVRILRNDGKEPVEAKVTYTQDLR